METIAIVLLVVGLLALAMALISLVNPKVQALLGATKGRAFLKAAAVAVVLLLVGLGMYGAAVPPEEQARRAEAKALEKRDALLATPLGEIKLDNQLDSIVGAYLSKHEDLHPSLRSLFKVCLSDMAKKKKASIRAEQALDWCETNRKARN